MANRAMITVVVMTAAFMTVLDTTIANVALPHMAGSVSASADQITWVLTSYIVASAIMTPTSAWLAGRLGQKPVFIVSVAGFAATSAMCGAAQTLDQIVLFRALQGAFGAAMGPLSQSVMLDAYPLSERGPAMAIWGMGMMVGPVAGPVLGGWLTENFSWRWVFYINVPFALACVAGLVSFLPNSRPNPKLPFDITGFVLLSTALAAFQLFLDRGQNKGWFDSTEIMVEASIAAVALVLFIIHTLLTDRPFVPPGLFADGNFVMAMILSMAVGMVVFSMIALLPPMLESLMAYPVLSAGLVMAPRGMGSVISMFLAGRMVQHVEARILIIGGLVMFALAFIGMSHFALGMGSWSIMMIGVVQGLGTGFVFTPMTMVAFATLAPSLRADGAGLYTLTRNLGNSVGISIMEAIFATNQQVVHSRLVERLTPDNPLAVRPYLAPVYSLRTPMGLAALDAEANRQAAMVSYIDIFHLLFIITALMAPLVLMLKPSAAGSETTHEVMAE
ncbi:MAG: DHA2 family efflux MFS transporter permease subunit [Caulobacteraceae bacterium]|nr:DHA2 family efflux MFS transporter permease subunit [Caulobacteraceae bacterium]